MERDGVSQAIWNSARTVLKEMGIVDGDTWCEREEIGEDMSRVHADDDKIWVPNNHGLRVIVVSDKLVGNSYIDPNQCETRVSHNQPSRNHSNHAGGVGG